MNETITAIEKRAGEAHAEAVAIVIRDQDSLTLANTKTIAIKALIKEIDDTFKPIHEAQKATAALTKETWDRYRVPLETDFKRIKRDIGDYQVEQDRLRREAEHRIWQAQQDKIRAEAEALRVAQVAINKAAIAEANGDAEKADKILEKAVVQESKISEKIEAAAVAASAPIPEPAKASGFSYRTDWDIKLVDINAVPREYLMFDDVKARKVVRASKGSVKITGVLNIEKRIDVQR